MLCVKSVLSSTVATGTPLRNSTRSMQFSLATEYRSCRTTRSRFCP